MSDQGNMPVPDRRFLAVRCFEQTYALPVGRVTQIVRVPTITKVPQAPPALAGLANLRGSIVPIADLNGLLRLGIEPVTDTSRAVIIDAPAPFALLVRDIDGIISVKADQIQQATASTGGQAPHQDAGVFSNAGTPVKILDVDKLLEGTFTPQPHARISGQRGSMAVESGGKEIAARDMLVAFTVDKQNYALPFSVVQEIFNTPDTLTSLPGADAQVPGLISFRNGLLPLLSLRALFGLGAHLSGAEKVIVTYIRGVAVGVVVDAVRQSIAIDPVFLEPVPTIMAARIGGEAKVKAIYRSGADRRLISVLDPDMLLNEETMRRLGPMQTPARNLAVSTSDAGSRMKLLAFQLGDDEFALPIEVVEEVALVPERMTRVPKTPKFLEGVINLRGDVLPVIDQRKRFDMPPLKVRERSRLIVVRSGAHRAGVIVDSVSEVLQVETSALAPAPNLAGEPTRLIQSVASLDGGARIIMLLDPAELLTRAERTLLNTFRTKLQN